MPNKKEMPVLSDDVVIDLAMDVPYAEGKQWLVMAEEEKLKKKHEEIRRKHFLKYLRRIESGEVKL